MNYFERIDRKIGNMSAMLKRFGIDPAILAQRQFGALFATSMRACQMCPNGERCQRWLDCADQRIDRLPEFCPNAQRLHSAKAAMESSWCLTRQC